MRTKRIRRFRRLILPVAAWVALGFALRGAEVERPDIGEFTAARFERAPVIDGVVAHGEWDPAFGTSGFITPFGHELQEAVTEVSLGYTSDRLFFLVRCVRGDHEWRLRKQARGNDEYDFGDSSVEIWVTPPAAVPETYQSVINTFPAVLDMKMVPSRGYTAQGWQGNWDLAVSESDREYVLEASIPIADFEGFETIRPGDSWRFLLCRTSPGTEPRPQASWSVTQGFAELNRHPVVHFRDDSPVVRLRGVESLLSGKPELDVTLVGARDRDDRIRLELLWHRGARPDAPERTDARDVELAAGAVARVAFAEPPPVPRGFLTVSARTAAGETLFRQCFPYASTGWVPKTPTRPDGVPVPPPVDVRAWYGPESDRILVRTDILDLPSRERARGGRVRLTDAADGTVLAESPLAAFARWYAHNEIDGSGLDIPLADYTTPEALAAEAENRRIRSENRERKARGEAPLPLGKAPAPEPRPLRVEVEVWDEAGRVLQRGAAELPVRRYRFPWQDNAIGMTDDVIPPWDPVTIDGETVSVWNRRLGLNGLGLLVAADNGGTAQVESMRLVAFRGAEEHELTASAPRLVRRVPARVDLAGEGAGGGLRAAVETKVEFDGFVHNRLTLMPDGTGQTVDRLMLELVLPESEATHFCTTAGGWAAVHGETPAYWSSQKTGSGILSGDFVPYIWLTNSDRAFLWFADNDEGWVTDDDRSRPTQEIIRRDGRVILRVNFIELPVVPDAPRTLEWGYQLFPSRPLPPGWRAIVCGNDPAAFPGVRNTYFWYEADWAVLWPYYCSPYPWDLDTSRAAFERFPATTRHRPMVGSIAHSIGRYRDYAGNEFPEYAVDWGENPGDLTNANVSQGRGATDFRLWHYQRWVREAGFRGLYIDENYLGAERNPVAGGAYRGPDGSVRPGYSYLGLREYLKRMMVMFRENGVPRPNLWQHISSGAAYHAWLGDIFFEGENVEPTDLTYDYLEVLPASRMRAIGSARCAGGVMTMMCQSRRHPTEWEPKHTHQFLGWVMAHDILPEQVAEYHVIAREGRLHEDDVRFHAYWHADSPFGTEASQAVVSAHRVGDRALVWIVNTARQDREIPVRVKWDDLGFAPADAVLVHAETGARIAAEEPGFRLPITNRDFAAVHILRQDPEDPQVSFRAAFEDGPAADYAWGCDAFVPANPRGEPVAVRDGALDTGAEGVSLLPHLHLTPGEGRVSFRALLTDAADGDILVAGGGARNGGAGGDEAPLRITIAGNELVFAGSREDNVGLNDRVVRVPRPAPGWHPFDLRWRGGMAALRIGDGAVVLVPCEAMHICDTTGKDLLGTAPFRFGGKARVLAAIDDVILYRRSD